MVQYVTHTPIFSHMIYLPRSNLSSFESADLTDFHETMSTFFATKEDTHKWMLEVCYLHFPETRLSTKEGLELMGRVTGLRDRNRLPHNNRIPPLLHSRCQSQIRKSRTHHLSRSSVQPLWQPFFSFCFDEA